MSRTNNNKQYAVWMGVTTALAATSAYYYYYYYYYQQSPSKKKKKFLDEKDRTTKKDPHDLSDDITVKSKGRSFDMGDRTTTTRTDDPSSSVEPSSNVMDETTLHARIEELDKKGKSFFKNKQFLEAAQAFTDALTLVDETSEGKPKSNSLKKQVVTLINNRSAMYEKGNLPELALDDCVKILDDYDKGHIKARLRKLRILESFKEWYQGLVEVCALQLMYMQQHRDQLRMGIPPATQPPVPQSKLEELLQKVLPGQMEELLVSSKNKDLLPSDYTLTQLLKSYTGYNAWMAKAAKDGGVGLLKKQLEEMGNDEDPEHVAQRASILLKMGRRQVYDATFADARATFFKAYELLLQQGETKMEVKKAMKDDDYVRLVEWIGMAKHWSYDLDGASQCYQECIEMEPINAELLVKKAGVAMDGGKHDIALNLFEKALIMDPDTVDALLHRANLRMLQGNLVDAQADLERCTKLRPNHVMAHLRLAAVLTSKNDTSGAAKHLKMAATVEPNSSEVQSYQGELFFTQNEFEQAKEKFVKAIQLEPKNPTPYVNAALACLNSPPEPGQQLEIAKEAIQYLEKVITIDPQFHVAYIQLGQLKLGMAEDLGSAREVLQLYEQGLSYCKTKEEMKDLCSMKILTQAQVDAANMLKMESFSVQ